MSNNWLGTCLNGHEASAPCNNPIIASGTLKSWNDLEKTLIYTMCVNFTHSVNSAEEVKFLFVCPFDCWKVLTRNKHLENNIHLGKKN